MAAGILATAIAFTIVFVVPVLGYRRYQQMKQPGLSDERRHELLLRSVMIKWCLVPPILLVWMAAPDAVQFSTRDGLWWLNVELLVGVAVGAVIIAVRLRSDRQRAKVARAAAKFAFLLPRNPQERRFFVIVAITAGVTEEIAYRAFLIAYLVWILPGDSWGVAAVIAGTIFGLLHAYQGWKGVLTTGVLGILFGFLYLTIGLVSLMIIHTLIDLRLLLIPADLEEPQPTTAPTERTP